MLTGTVVSLEQDPFVALNLLQVLIDLNKIMGSEGLVPLEKKLQMERRCYAMCPSTISYTSLEHFTHIFLLVIPTPGLDGCSPNGNKLLVHKSSRRIQQRVVFSKWFYSPRYLKMDILMIENG